MEVAENSIAVWIRVLIYLINSKCDLNWPICVHFCHDIMGIRVDRVGIDTKVL